MFSRTTFLKVSASMILAFATMPFADAQTAPVVPSAPVSRPNAFKQCAAENNITLPEKGSGQQLNQGERQAIHACVKAAYKAAWQQCSQTAGFTPGQGQKPTREQRHEIRACMAKAGFHHHGRGFKNQRGNEQTGSQQPAEAVPQSN